MSKSNNSKAEVVLIIGNDLPKDEIQKEIQNKFPGFEDKIIFLGNGEIINSEFDLSPLQSRTNENTLFILYTHGIIDDGHIPSGGDIATGIFLQNLQNKVGHKIVVAADSCRVGKMLKINEIESDKISVLAEAGSSYQTLTVQNTKSVIESVSQKLSGRNNLEILSRKIGSRPETLYFLPFENKILSGPESKLDADYKAEIKRPGYKFSRPGKFTLDEIKEILRSVYEDKKVITTHLQKFINTNKFDFSINKIKQILELTDEDLETKDSDKLKFKNDLLEKFREKLQNKFTEKSIITFFKARRDKFNKITKINNQTDFEKINYREVIADFWFMAALRNYDEEISAILKNYPDFINIENNRGYVENGRGYTALKYAADDDNFEVVKILIAAGADVNWADNDGQSILMYAAASTMNRYGFSKDETKARVVKSLIRAGAKIDTVDKDGRSALIWAIKKGNTAIVMTLIENEADISLIDKDGWPALLYVAASKDMILRGTGVEILEKLIQAKVDVNFCDRNGKSVLTYAIEATNWPVVLQLINARAIEKDDDLILINIIKNIDKIGQGNFIGISLTRQAIKLIEAGARTDTVDKDGKSALILATEKNFLEIVDTLVKAKNVVHQEMFFLENYSDDERKSDTEEEIDDEEKNNNTLQEPVKQSFLEKPVKQETKDILSLELLIKDKSNIDEKDQDGFTALILAAKEGRNEDLKILLTAKADIMAKDNDGLTALMWAVREQRINASMTLIIKGLESKLKELLEAQDNNGFTPLMWAAYIGNKELVSQLIVAGTSFLNDFDINAKDNNGRTALGLAKQKGHKEAAEILISFGANDEQQKKSFPDVDEKVVIHTTIPDKDLENPSAKPLEKKSPKERTPNK